VYRNKTLTQLGAQADNWLAEISIQGSRQFSEAFYYALNTPGKRFRPIALQLVAQALGVKSSKIKVLAQSIELLHTSSLVHDDLPALDNDSLRRGRPTVHVKFGEAVAILVGDALVGEAFRILGANEIPGALIAKFATAYSTICEGQVLDLDFSIDSLEQIKERHHKKTGAMIELAISAAGILAEKKEAALLEFGRDLGLLFQLVDDVRDVTKSPEVLGKTSKLDAQLGRVTAVSFLGLEKTNQLIEETAASARASLKENALEELEPLIEALLFRLEE